MYSNDKMHAAFKEIEGQFNQFIQLNGEESLADSVKNSLNQYRDYLLANQCKNADKIVEKLQETIQIILDNSRNDGEKKEALKKFEEVALRSNLSQIAYVMGCAIIGGILMAALMVGVYALLLLVPPAVPLVGPALVECIIGMSTFFLGGFLSGAMTGKGLYEEACIDESHSESYSQKKESVNEVVNCLKKIHDHRLFQSAPVDEEKIKGKGKGNMDFMPGSVSLPDGPGF
ncbi:hypothetical protein [Legionella fairfieldensis]|uniref:hypothetical protein n=1 Tax=Legionella fairfieldensis TaxID=45064 RepID=UPI000490F09B|nr:hypothetical protein [Legionella fairfieldensis]